MTLRPPVPDLLMRFTPTPYRLISKGIVIETNDLDILDQFEGPYGTAALAVTVPELHLRVVRDPAAADLAGEVQTLEFDALRVTTAGAGTALLFDREQRKIFAFVASDVPPRTLVESFLFGALLSATTP